MKNPHSHLYEFIDSQGTFRVDKPLETTGLYFPLANEAGLLSAITPDLQGDIKLDQHSFLTLPISFEDLNTNRASRNFWISLNGKDFWALNGHSVWQRALPKDAESSQVEAGFLWHKMTRTNKKMGLSASVLSFVPAIDQTFEVMLIEIKNTSKKSMKIVGTSAVPLFGRSADNLRDHRHVTSLLHRLDKTKYGIQLRPTMSFNERGHSLNNTSYYLSGVDEKGSGPAGFFPTVQSFVGEGGDLEKPAAIVEAQTPQRDVSPEDQGKEAMGALQFKPFILKAGKSTHFILILGINPLGASLDALMTLCDSKKKVEALLQTTKEYWAHELSRVEFKTGDPDFNNWIRWVCLQPTLRKIYGCSFLPDFDYGRGGRGWRDLWQDCLALLLQNPESVRPLIHKNFCGIRIDGSNATIIGRKKSEGGKKGVWEPEFIADRNNITRTWMDHGTWPFLTTLLYLNQTGDWDFLFEKASYFRDAQRERGRRLDAAWLRKEEFSSSKVECVLRTKNGQVYEGTVLEHILVQTLVQFFNVGDHNIIRLEDADWNDGLDMAREKGESVAFTSLYAGNLEKLAELLKNAETLKGVQSIVVFPELKLLLSHLDDSINYNNPKEKTELLQKYFKATENGVSDEEERIPIGNVIKDLEAKAAWIKSHVNKQEWIQNGTKGWFNGYYDNKGKRVEGSAPSGKVHMTLTGQVYPIMTGLADDKRIEQTVHAVDQVLWDKALGGYRLNSDFGGPQPDLGRAFSFAYGEKENGAVFSHMVVMYANALYQRGFVKEGYRALHSLYKLAINSNRSRILPGLPEYFNNEARGRYHYLTGSASWYVLTLLTEVFGVKGELGNLTLTPKIEPEQFDDKGRAEVDFFFAGVRFKVVYENKAKVSFNNMKITSLKFNGDNIPYQQPSKQSVVFNRKDILGHKKIDVSVVLGKA